MIDYIIVSGGSLLTGFMLGALFGLGRNVREEKARVAETSDEDPRRLERTGHIPHDMRQDDRDEEV